MPFRSELVSYGFARFRPSHVQKVTTGVGWRTSSGVRVACLAAALAGVMLHASAASARGPYVVLKDDGTLNGKLSSPREVIETVMKSYDASGAERPDVISLWTSFSTNKSDIETLYGPVRNDITGIGLEHEYGGADGTFDKGFEPVRAILLHNNVLALEKRAKRDGAPLEGYADYLFLLELSHVWGPAIRVPASNASSSEALIGFPFHWSYWMDAGESPAGGNTWKDNGNGTFTAAPHDAGKMSFSMLDLYLMGLADPSEVPPFGVLENIASPSTTDPDGRRIEASSFPRFDGVSVTVAATRRSLAITDVVATNGSRVPARKDAPSTFKLGIVLVVKKDAGDAEIARAEAAMDPVAVRLAPAFERATGGRGKMVVVTASAAPSAAPAEPTVAVEEPVAAEPAATPVTPEPSGCAIVERPSDLRARFPASSWAVFGALGAAAAVFLRRRGRGRSAP